MIGSKQVKQIIDYSFSYGAGSFLSPEATFIATPNSYTATSPPGGNIILSGSIIPNDGTDISWVITNSVGTPLADGVDNTPSHSIAPPASIGSYTYNLNVSYKNDVGTTIAFVIIAVIVVSADGKVGQLDGPGDDFTTPAEFDVLNVEGGFIFKTNSDVINLFSFEVTSTARTVIVIPDSFGSVVDIQDNTDNSVLSQFNTVADVGNTRTLYVTDLALTPGTYFYKVVF